jgi:hypothetical protein
MLQTFSTCHWNEHFSDLQQEQAIHHLETGQILFFPELFFTLSEEEKYFLSSDHADPHAKHISYHPESHKLWGVQRLSDDQRTRLKGILDRFTWHAFGLIQALLPHYVPHLTIARTSFRPIQANNRKTSFRKDDRRLHIDAFPSAPNQGKRILRVFSNINPNGEDRVWRIGEPFEKVAEQFLPHIKKPVFGTLAALRLLRITKSYRTLYDHYMLHMHDNMKANDRYQKEADQQEVRFPPGSSWIVQTDHVSHAAMQGQYMLEQTFYLPVQAMKDESHSPLRVLERMLNTNLV